MIVLVPLSRFTVTYEIGSGRPYSKFEELVLRAIGEGIHQLDDLQENFQLHPRLLLEVLVTLTRAGWVAVSNSENGGFLLTRKGNSALKNELRPEFCLFETRYAKILMERLVGKLCDEREVSYSSTRKLKNKKLWDHRRQLRTAVFDNRLVEAQVQHLLPYKNGEWLRWIGPIELVSRDFHWLEVDVDLDEGRILGLPPVWETQLHEYIMEETKERWGELSSGDDEEPSVFWSLGEKEEYRKRLRKPEGQTVQEWKIRMDSKDFLTSSEEHEQMFRDLLEKAEENSTLFLASSSPHIKKLEALKETLKMTLKRGLNIDVLWGGDCKKEIVDWFGKLAFHSKRDNFQGRLCFNKFPAHIHTNFLIWKEKGNFQACIGSFDWLSDGELNSNSSPLIYASVKVHFEELIASFCRCAASIWSSIPEERLSEVPNRWRQIASLLGFGSTQQETKILSLSEEIEEEDLSGTFVEESANCTVRFELTRTSNAFLQEILRKPKSQITVASSQLLGSMGPKEPFSMYNWKEQENASSYSLIYGEAPEWEITDLEELQKRFEPRGRLLMKASLRANIAICDNSMLICTDALLSTGIPAYKRGRGWFCSLLVLDNEVVSDLARRQIFGDL